MATDSLWFHGLTLSLPNTQLHGDGRYMMTSGDLDASLRAAPLALTDLRFAYPRMPANGSGSMDLTAAMRHTGESDYVARNVDLAVDGGTMRGQLGLAVGQRSDELRLHDTQLAFKSIDTRTIEQLVPTVKIPRRGAITGRATLAGTTAAMRIDADVAFAERRSGTSRVLVVGVAGSGRARLHREESSRDDHAAPNGARAHVRSDAPDWRRAHRNGDARRRARRTG